MRRSFNPPILTSFPGVRTNPPSTNKPLCCLKLFHKVKGIDVGNRGNAASEDDGDCHASSSEGEDSWDDDDDDDDDDYDDDDYDDEFEAYDMRDDQADLAKVAVPVYLDQLIESEPLRV